MLSKNLVASYVALVGIPILALIGILDAGHDLRAPVSVSGAWDLQADWGPLTSAPCAVLWADSSEQRVLEVSQSGKYLTLSIDPLTGSGTIENGRLTAEALRPMKPVSCQSGENSVNFKASFESSDAMNGSLRVNGCASCSGIPFRAVRRKETKAER
jgi:hypothetical protein